MSRQHMSGIFVALIVLAVGPYAVAGDSFVGKVTKVRSAEPVVVDYGKGQYVVRIVGIVIPKEAQFATKALRFNEGLDLFLG